jgi:hypothetical protein
MANVKEGSHFRIAVLAVKTRLAVIEVLGALIAGSLLYMLARPRGLIAFGWFAAVGLGDALAKVRAAVLPFTTALPSFVRFSVPDGLWAFAFTRAMILVWSGTWSRASAPWILLAPMVAIGSELGQGLRIVPGTFDVVDLLSVTLGSALALWRMNWRRVAADAAGGEVV